MQTKIRLIAQHYNAGTGQILEETILRDDKGSISVFDIFGNFAYYYAAI